MKKRLVSMKLVDIAGERTSSSPRRDSDNLSAEEYARISTEQTSASTSSEVSIISKSTAEACASTSTTEACASTSTTEACASTSTTEACASTSTTEACASTSTTEACAKKSFWDGITLDSLRCELKLNRLFSDFPRMKLPFFVNFGKLLCIAQKYVEFRSIIRAIFLLNKALPFLNIREQKQLVASVVELNVYISDLSQMQKRCYDEIEMNRVYFRIGYRLDYLYYVLEKTRVLRYSQLVDLGLYVPLSEFRMNVISLEMKEGNLDSSFLRRINVSQTDLRTHLDTRYLRNIKHDHWEFGPCVRVLLGVYESMKYLPHEAQLKVFKFLYRIQEMIRELVLYKRCCDVYSFEKLIPVLLNQLSMCLYKLLESLGDQILPPLYFPSCEQCQTVSKYVKNVDVKPEDVERRPVTHQVGQISTAAFANVGVTQGRIRNLESLFHHLTVIREAAYMFTSLYQSRIDWFEIARQYKEYQTKARQDLAQLGIWKDHSFWRLVELQDIVAEAQTFCDVLRGICYTRNDTLSNSIALGGELELLASEAEHYLTWLGELIGQFLQDWPKYVSVNRGLRKSRLSFLTKDQWEAFDFPI